MTPEERAVIDVAVEWHETSKPGRVSEKDMNYFLHTKVEQYLASQKEAGEIEPLGLDPAGLDVLKGSPLEIINIKKIADKIDEIRIAVNKLARGK